MFYGGWDPASGEMVVLQGKTLRFLFRPAAMIVQRITVAGAPIAGGFRLGICGTITNPIPVTATATEVEDIVNDVLGEGNVKVLGGPGPSRPWWVVLTGRYRGATIAAGYATDAYFTGGTDPYVTVAVDSPGGPLMAPGVWTAACHFREGPADTYTAAPLLTVPITITADGVLDGTAVAADTDAVKVEKGWFEIEATHVASGWVGRVQQGTWRLSRSVVR